CDLVGVGFRAWRGDGVDSDWWSREAAPSGVLPTPPARESRLRRLVVPAKSRCSPEKRTVLVIRRTLRWTARSKGEISSMPEQGGNWNEPLRRNGSRNWNPPPGGGVGRGAAAWKALRH